MSTASAASAVTHPYDERGFSLIELLTVVAILGILATIAINTFWTYRDMAIFAQAQSTLRHSLVALEAGRDELPDLGNLDESSGVGGGPTVGNLGVALPGMMLTEGVQLRLSLVPCGFDNKVMTTVYAYACAPDLYTFWMRTCGDVEFTMPKAVGAGVC